MKAHAEITQGLSYLAQSISTILQQLRVHRNMCEFWGYQKLALELGRQRDSLSEGMDAVLKRMLALEQSIDLQHLGRLNIGQTVEEILVSEREMCEACYSLANRLAVSSHSDVSTRQVTENAAVKIAERMEFFDQQLEMIRQMGVQNFLAMRC